MMTRHHSRHVDANDALTCSFVFTRSFVSFFRCFVHSFIRSLLYSLSSFCLLMMFMMLLLCQGTSRLLVSSNVHEFRPLSSDSLACLFAPDPSIFCPFAFFLSSCVLCTLSLLLTPLHPTLLSTIDTSTRPFPSFSYAQGSHLYPLKVCIFTPSTFFSPLLLFSLFFSSLSSFLPPPSFAIVPILFLAHRSFPSLYNLQLPD